MRSTRGSRAWLIGRSLKEVTREAIEAYVRSAEDTRDPLLEFVGRGELEVGGRVSARELANRGRQVILALDVEKAASHALADKRLPRRSHRSSHKCEVASVPHG